jgi:hypothetical protein
VLLLGFATKVIRNTQTQNISAWFGCNFRDVILQLSHMPCTWIPGTITHQLTGCNPHITFDKRSCLLPNHTLCLLASFGATPPSHHDNIRVLDMLWTHGFLFW